MSPEERDHLLKLLRMFSSDQVGERAVAAMKAHEYAKKFGGWDKCIGADSNTQEWADYGKKVAKQVNNIKADLDYRERQLNQKERKLIEERNSFRDKQKSFWFRLTGKIK